MFLFSLNAPLARRIVAAGLAGGLALALAACGGDDADSGGMADMPGMGQDAPSAATAWNDADVAFAQMMISDHQMVGAMADMAQTKASMAELKTLAPQLKSGQDEAVRTLTGWLAAWGKPASADMAGMQMPGAMTEKDMAALEAMSGMDFDMTFATKMIEHHQGSITMAKDELANGKNPEAKAMATTMVEKLTAEIAELKKIASM